MVYMYVFYSQKRVNGSGTDPISLLILLFLWSFGDRLSKSLRLSRFKSDPDEIWQECSLSKYASHDGVGFSILRHTLEIVAMTSFHPEKCFHLVSAHTQRMLGTDVVPDL